MALFTESQASSSKIEKITKTEVNGSFSSWKVQISGSDGEVIMHRIRTLDGDASISDIKSETIAYLTGSVNYTVPVSPPTVTVTEEFSSNVGDTLG
jgi:hypothetical protein